MKPDVVYRVTKGNTDGSINVDDIVYVDKEDDSIVIPRWGKRFNKEELTDSATDFECEIDRNAEHITIATATQLRTSTKKDCASFPKKRQQPEIQTGRGIVQ